jgi:gamma-glutamyltranspeptidase
MVMMENAQGTRGMVTAPHHLASKAGLSVLQDGGTAIEAAIATAACLAAVYPHMTGIGGDGFWLISEPDGSVWAIDACGRSPLSLDKNVYRGMSEIPWRGPLAANTVAGTISGWDLARGSLANPLPLERLLKDAILYAGEGVEVTAGGAELAASKSAELRNLPGAYSSIFEPHGRPVQQGEILRQPQLAATLQQLAKDGLDSFYRGALAQKISKDLTKLGSPLEAADLAAHRASSPKPLSARLRDATLFNTAPPTQGLASLLILALFDRLTATEVDGFDHIHGLVEATKQAFLVRDAHVGDPAFMDIDPQSLLDDDAAIDAMVQAVDPATAMPWPRPSALGDTCWFAAADERGQVVSCIQSTYFEFGSGLVLPQTGITWQNRGCSFRLADDGWNALKPGRKPFHTLNPALAKFNDGRVMAYGTMGGEGQPQTQAALFSRYARFGIPLQQAISAPRWLLGRTWGETSTSLKLEDRFPPALYDQLRAAGHDLELVAPMTAMMGHAGAIVRHADGSLEGANDPRSDGAAVGY